MYVLGVVVVACKVVGEEVRYVGERCAPDHPVPDETPPRFFASHTTPISPFVFFAARPHTS
jgi:hypothetical protein